MGSLVAGNELGGIGETVVDEGISQVVVEVLKGTLAGDDGLDEETKHGEHGETAVLDFLHLELSQCVGVVSETQGVEGTTGVGGVETLSPGTSTLTTASAEGFGLTHEDDLDGHGGNDGLGVDKVGVAEVVQAIVGEDGGTGLEPGGSITKAGNTVGLEELRGEAAEGTKHGPAGVDHFDLAIAGKGLGVSGETGGIPAVVSGVFTLEVRGDVALREGAEPFCAVCTQQKTVTLVSFAY